MSEARIKITIDGQEAESTVAAVNDEITELSAKIAGLDSASEEFKTLTDRVNQLQLALSKLDVSIDTSAAEKSIEDLATSIDELSAKPVEIEVSANVDQALTDIGSIGGQEVAPVELQVDTTSAQAEIDAISAEPIVVPVEADVSAAQQEVDAITGEPITVEVLANVDEAVTNIESLANVEPVEVPVSIDPASIQESIDSISSDPISVDVQADVSQAQQEIDSISSEPLTVPVVADTEEAVANIESLSNIEPVQLPVEADVTQAEEAIKSIAIEPLEVEITADPSQLQGELVGLAVDPIEVPVNADVTEAQAQIDALQGKEVLVTIKTESSGSSVSPDPGSIVVPVQADTTQVQESISELSADPIVLPVEADTEAANTEIASIAPAPIEVPVEANTDAAATDISSLDSDEVVVPVSADTSKAEDQIASIESEVDPIVIEPEVKVEKANTSIGSLRKQLVDLQAQLENEQIGSDKFKALEAQVASTSTELAKAKDRVEDLGDVISTNLGSPVERAKTSFALLQDGVSNLDLDKIKTGIKGLGSSLLDTVTGPFKKFGDELKGIGSGLGSAASSLFKLDFKGVSAGLSTATGGFKSLGAAIASTGIGALVIALVAVITNFDKLKSIGGPIGAVFKSIGDAIGFVTGLLKDFSDAILGTNFAETDALDKANKAYEDKAKTIEQTTKENIAALKAQGATEKEIAEESLKGAQAQVAASDEVVKANQKILDELQARKDAGEELTESEQEQYNKAIENINSQIAANEKLIESQQKLRDVANEEQAARDQIAVLSAKTDKARLEAQKQLISNAESVAVQRAQAEGKGEDIITAIRVKANSDRSKLDDDYNKQAQAKIKARIDAVNALENEFVLSDRQRIEATFDAKIKVAQAQGIYEGEIIDGINAKRLAALYKFDAEERKREEDRATKRIELINQIAILEAEARGRAAVEAAPDPKAAAQAQIEADKEISDLRIQALEDQKNRALKIQAETTAAELKQANLTEEQKTQIVADGELAQQKIILDSDAAIAQAKAEQAQKEKEAAIKRAQEEVDLIKAAREKLKTNDNAQLGLLGLSSNIDALQAGLDEELRILQENLDKKLISEEEYQQKKKEIEEEGQAVSRELSAAAIETTAQQASQVVDIIGSFQQAQREVQAQNIETERTELQTQYEQRKAFIEANISDETKRAEALAALDKELLVNNQKLDKQALELKKKGIKQDRNVAVAQIILSTAIGIAGALKSASGSLNPVAFALTLAAGLAAVVATIAKANAALKAADASLGAIGAGGGGPEAPAPQVGSGAQAIAPQVEAFTPTGVNNAQQVADTSGQPIVVNSVVSVLDINAAQNRVSVAETNATIGTGG